MFQIGLNAYDEPVHWAALNENNVYLSCTSDVDVSFLNHMHKSCELLLVEEGGAIYTIGNEDYHLTPGSLLIIGAMDPHIRQVTEFPFIRYGLTILPQYIDSLPLVNQYVETYRTPSQADFAKLSGMEEECFDRIRQIFLELGRETTSLKVGHADMTYALMLELTITLSRLLEAQPNRLVGNPAYSAMAEIKAYIDGHFDEDLSLSVLASRFFVGTTTISRNFAQFFDVNVHDYVASVRITHATRLLENTSISVTDLALKVGYGSVNTFIRQFRSKIGVSPLRYRKQFSDYLRRPGRSRRLPVEQTQS